jgi:hypothetical protein
VQTYNLQGQVVSRVVPAAVQDLTNATIVIEGGVTIMDFTRPLVSLAAKEVKKDVPQSHIFAYAAGRSSLAEHSGFGIRTLNLAECTVVVKKGLTSIEKHALLMAVGESLCSCIPLCSSVAVACVYRYCYCCSSCCCCCCDYYCSVSILVLLAVVIITTAVTTKQLRF